MNITTVSTVQKCTLCKEATYNNNTNINNDNNNIYCKYSTAAFFVSCSELSVTLHSEHSPDVLSSNRNMFYLILSGQILIYQRWLSRLLILVLCIGKYPNVSTCN